MIKMSPPEGALSDFRMMKHWMEERTKIQSGFQFDRQTILWNHGTSGNTIMLLFRLTPNAVMITSKEDNICHAMPLGKIQPSQIIDMVCENGIVRVNETNDKEVLITAFSQTAVGDMQHIIPEFRCKGGMLYGSQASVLAQLELATECIKALAGCEQKVTVAIVNETVIGEAGVLGMITKSKPDSLLVIAAILAEKEFVSGQGPGVAVKDGNWLAERTLWESISQLVPKTQLYLGNNGTLLERCYLSLKSKKLAAIYLPVVKMGSRVEEVKQTDIEKTQNLLLKCVETFGIIGE